MGAPFETEYAASPIKTSSVELAVVWAAWAGAERAPRNPAARAIVRSGGSQRARGDCSRMAEP